MIVAGEPLDAIHARLNTMPAQSIRSLDKDALQMFSTPPKHGALAALAAQFTPTDIGLEPSCGTGMIAAYATRSNIAGLYLNELDGTRLGIAKRLIPHRYATTHDASFLHATFKGRAPSIVLMNPPFSVDAVGNTHGSSIGLRHVAAAVHLAAQRGRVVAILGSNQHPALSSEWKNIIGTLPVQIRAAVMIDGKDYYRMGTTFDNCLVVLDKTTDELPCLVSNVTPTPIDELLATFPTIERLVALEQERRTFSVAGPQISSSRSRTWVPTFKDIVDVTYRYEVPERDTASGAFVPFTAHIVTEGATDHPAELVESVALSMVKPPSPSVKVPFPADRISSLSREQWESVILANAAFTRTTYPDGEPVTGGFMSGHGTGFGKGRTNAGIILSQMVQGRTKAIWFSKTRDLMEDAVRDWTHVAGDEHEDAIFDLTLLQANTEIAHKHGIMFSTYATARSEARQGVRARLEQIIEWVGADFDGVIVFDEAHELANAMAAENERGKTDASKQGLAALELQQKLPKASIVYTSATSASKVDAFAYAPRLGFWGRDTAFPARREFLSAMHAGGTGAMELLCRDAKALGVYISAALTLDGVGCERLEHTLNADEIAAYNEVARAWSVIRASVDEQLDGRGGVYSSVVRAQLASSSMRSMQALLTSLAMTSVIPRIDAALDCGHAPVIQLANTYEADQERALSKVQSNEDLESIDLSPKETLRRYLMETYPIAALRPIADDEGEIVRWEPVTDDDGQLVADPAAVEKRDGLLAAIDCIIPPDSPISQLTNTYGDRLAECTGRARRVVRKVIDGVLTTVVEKRGSTASSDDTDAFMNGDKDLLLFSEKAGGTGRSYHADRRAKNQKPRDHFALQLGWRAEEAIQGFGRTNRANQAHKPNWILVTTDAPGQRRFISSIARRLEQLGACTRGQRDASGTALFSAEDNLESEYATHAVNTLLQEIAGGTGPISYEDWLTYTGIQVVKPNSRKPLAMTVTRFLNQILCCPLDIDTTKSPQHLLMDALVTKTHQNIEAAKAKGSYDEGLQQLIALRIDKTDERVLYTDPTGATTMLVDLNVTREAHRNAFGTALSAYRRSKALYSGFGRFVKTCDGIRLVYKVADVTVEGKNESHMRVMSPATTVDHIGIIPAEFANEPYTNEDVARTDWKTELELVNETYTEKLFLVCGTLLPIYDALPKNRAKIYAVILPGGQRLLGRVLTPTEANGLLAHFNLGTATSLEDAIAHVSQGGTALLTRTYTLSRVMHEGRRRLELTGDGSAIRAAATRAEQAGLEVVRKGFQIRCFLPQHDIMEALARFDNTLAVVSLSK
ncbi:MAG TPA: strawberry notch family protein, partial [Candidatus Baltobacteraceae bacterium]|nr:strawberry notch family protein [Candidatus Baltobacteraceae bacterium]